MVSGIDVLFTDLEESIPDVLVNAMRSGEANVVRGLQAMSGSIMWHFTHPVIHLIEVIVDARREDGVVYAGTLEDVMCSVRGDEIVNDFIEWGLLEPDIDSDGEEIFVAPGIWDTFISTLDDEAPDMGLESLGKILGICSLVKHRGDRRQRPIGLKLYEPIKALAARAKNQGGNISQSDARAQFTRYSSWDADKRWLHLTYGDRQRVNTLRFFSDMTGDPWILNPDVSVALERILGRTNELLRERGILK
ncbi:unnamed protein product, partial [marine sediment metagenome]